jgi:hypothetical protein
MGYLAIIQVLMPVALLVSAILRVNLTSFMYLVLFVGYCLCRFDDARVHVVLLRPRATLTTHSPHKSHTPYINRQTRQLCSVATAAGT